MSKIAEFVQEGNFINHTPSSADVAAGDVVQLADGLIGVADRAIKQGEVGALRVNGVYRFIAAGAITAGAKVTLASSGKISAWSTAATDPVIGIALTAATAANDAVQVLINGGSAAALAAAGVNAAAIELKADK